MSDSGQMPDAYDRLLGALHGLPDVVSTQPSMVRAPSSRAAALLRDFAVRASRWRAIVSATLAGIARRRLPSRRVAQKRQERKDRGEQPGFMKNPGRRLKVIGA